LILVVRVNKLAWIGALARRSALDEANDGIADGDGIVRARLEMSKRCFADQTDGLGGRPPISARSCKSNSRGTRSWSSGAPLIATLVNFALALAPKFETALATVFTANLVSGTGSQG
jgi:hypothetical protein